MIQRRLIATRRPALVLIAALLGALSTPGGIHAQTPQPLIPVSRLDVNHNGLVNASDVMHSITGWISLQESGSCISPIFQKYDLDGGCLDVSDAQRVAAGLGQLAQPNVAIPGITVPAEASDTTFVVNSTANDADAKADDGLCKTSKNTCTLRAAIQQSNTRLGHETISFNIRNSDGSCPGTARIQPGSFPLDSGEENQSWFEIEDPNNMGVTIDGYSQCGAKANTGDMVGNAVIKVELKGQLQKEVHGIHISSANNVIRGLAIYNWDRQIFADGPNTTHTHFEGNFIGSDSKLSSTAEDMGTHHSEGLRLQYGSTYNVIGCGSFDAGNTFVSCTDPAQINAARNIIAGNGNDGIHFEGDVKYNHIVGNYIGLKQDGSAKLRNGADGVDIEEGPQYNWLGGLTPGERNVISGNGSEGLEVSHGTDTQFNSIVGNYFGLDAGGKKSVQNSGNGFSFEDTVDSNYAYNNIASGNYGNGIRFYVLATRNQIHHNSVGLAADGVTPLPNGRGTHYGQNGIYVMGGSQYNQIFENIIAHNPAAGVYLSNESDDDHGGSGKTFYNTISKNRMFNNGREGIGFSGSGSSTPNQNLAAPKLNEATNLWVTGTACAGCTVEVFLSDKTQAGGSEPAGEGMQFIGAALADALGGFVVQTTPTSIGQLVTATATDTKGNTSRFATNITVTVDASVTATSLAATAQLEATQTAEVLAATQTAAALATSSADSATQTAISVETGVALTATQSAIALTPTSTSTPVPNPGSDSQYRIALPLISRVYPP